MNKQLSFRKVSGVIHIPASKSHTQRVFAAALLRKGKTLVSNAGHSEDEIAALHIIQDLGATIVQEDGTIQISSDGIIKNVESINCGESGLAARLFTPIAALSLSPIVINGEGSLRKRPMHIFASVFEQLQIALPDFNGHIPFLVKGPLLPANISVDGKLSSQFISGLLFAYSVAAKEKVIIEVDELVSRPYIDLTLEVLEVFGKKVSHNEYRFFEIDPANFVQKPDVKISIESDWSSAAFWICAAALSGNLKLEGLNPNSKQADRILPDFIAKAGAQVHWQNEQLFVAKDKLQAFDADLNQSPDLFPVLAVFAACCAGKSRLKGLQRLIHKESNRAESICKLLDLLQVTFEIAADELIIYGTRSFPSISYDCPNDHRMAMAAALASIRCSGSIAIENAQCVGKSYPDFWEDVMRLTQ